MCNLGDAIERRGIALGIEKGISEGWEEGWKEGIRIGTFETNVRYYRKGRITAEEAASDLNMSLNEFLEKIKEGSQQPQM